MFLFRKGELRSWVVSSLFVLVVAGSARADRRSYVWTYEYQTVPKGMAELEYYLTTKIADSKNTSDKNTWEHQLEYEFGLTDRWDFSIYQMWKHTNTSSEDKFEYTGTKLRTRYRLGEKGMYPLDMLLYLEYIRPDGSGAPEILEGKLVLAKDIGKWNIAYNQIIKEGINNRGETEHEYAAGACYELSSAWKLGLESTGNLTEERYYLGPTLSWGSRRVWANIGFLMGLNDRSDDLRFRLIIGMPF